MKYFVTDNERTHTAYHEFYKGKWDGKTFWKADSLSLDDNVLYGHRGFADALHKAVPEFDPYGITEISAEQWLRLHNFIPEDDAESLEMYNEADKWLKAVFDEYGCFTILGL